ncbi:MAG: hypothetical protein JSS07_02070 [Proteobacteria bacterium]|nr:hypothetical protein [Pseudomonadota bacterium]
MNHKQAIDCILFSFNHQAFLLPTVAYAELGVLHDYQVNVKDFCLGTFLWRGLTLPLVRPDLTPANEEETHSKFAVLNTLGSKLNYFAILIDSQPLRQKIEEQDLFWKDKSKNIAIFKKNFEEEKEVNLIDLNGLCAAIEKIIL